MFYEYLIFVKNIYLNYQKIENSRFMDRYKKYLNIWNEDILLIRKYYEKKIKKYSVDSLKALDWGNVYYSTQFINNAIKRIDLKKVNSIFDIGCGTCVLYNHLKFLLNAVSYEGIDIVPSFIKFSKTKYPNISVKTSNFTKLRNLPIKKYDLVINLGGLNSRVRYFDQYLKYNIEKMISYTNRYVVFNIITSTDSNYFNFKKRINGSIHCYDKRRLYIILDFIKKRQNILLKVSDISIFKGSIDTYIYIEKNEVNK